MKCKAAKTSNVNDRPSACKKDSMFIKLNIKIV